MERNTCTCSTSGITTIHHDKPEEATITKMALKMSDNPAETLNVTLSPSERQKRLLPYENFYQTQPEVESLYQPTGEAQRFQFDRPPPPPPKNYALYYNEPDYQQEQDLSKFTPFSKSNAIPGPFRPMTPNRQQQKYKVEYVAVPQRQEDKLMDYSAIYDKLSQLKLQSSRRPTRPNYRPAEPQRYIVKPQQVNYNRYKTIQPTKTFIETYTATNIDIPNGEQVDEYAPQHLQPTPAKSYENEAAFYKSFQEDSKPYVNQQIAVEIPQGSYPHRYQPVVVQKPYPSPKQPYILVPKPSGQGIRKPVVVLQRKPVYHRIKPVFEDTNEDVTENYVPQYVTEAPRYQNHQRPYVENPNSLGLILKQLQATNTLPQTLTPDNIDNSIKTLVRILEALKKQQKLSKPIVVADDSVDYNGSDEEPGTITQTFPVEAPDGGGTPGKPGVDYPALSNIPQTSFNCKTQRYKGFFGDPDTHCQVWHYCDLNGGQASFLCPNGTIFSQVALTCDWWYNVKCSTTAQLYVLNERLYKYIIPLSPKFPEDYSGPLVDKYLALKFQEMEEKMRKEKKGKVKAEQEKENEGLQDIEADGGRKVSGIEEERVAGTQQRETLDTIEDDNDKE
ncbi:hypothetical protein NQ315_003074 [Exocentrus adspersus]|uniref:Chitin-binding type-2 domain-containing protein n=1 Tax=Exocentrus adspersus TaxID=1586481 RepID=A0AAV8W5Q2_9CUCU|nr:hypothetical protein NQ315_003074 [Exocentrus adspersus]